MTEPDDAIPEETIRKRSYEIWQRENCPTGRDRENWFRAKEELRAERLPRLRGGQIQLGDKSVCFWDHYG